MPERNVLPKPVQKPHPPLWVTVTSPGTELDAAERGLGCLGVATAGYAEQERRTREYHRRIQLCDPVSSAVNDRVTTLNFLYCHEDARRRRRARAAHARALRPGQLASALDARGLPDARLPVARQPRALRQAATRAIRAAVAARRRASASAIRAQIARAIERWQSIGVDGINFLINAVETLPQAQVLESLRLFAREVMPKFQGVA